MAVVAHNNAAFITHELSDLSAIDNLETIEKKRGKMRKYDDNKTDRDDHK